MSRLLLVFIFVLFTVSSVTAQGRISLTWEVQKYDITANLPQNFSNDRTLSVKATLNVKNISGKASSTLSMRISDQANVFSVQVNGATANFRKSAEKIGAKRNLQKIITRIPSVSPSQSLIVVVNYKITVKANSGLSLLSPIESQFLPLSHWYPTPTSWYFPGGADFAPYTLRINSLNGQTVVSAGTNSGNSYEQKLFGQPFFTTGQWRKINSNGIEVFAPKSENPEVKKRAEELARFAFEAKAFVSSLLGNTDNIPVRIVSVNRGAGFTEGGTIFVDDSVFKREKNTAQTAMIIAEGIAKVWFGNIFKVKENGYGVIREGLARYMATQFIEKKYGKGVANTQRLRQRISYSTISRRDAPLSAVSLIDDYYFTVTANKGSMIWRYLLKRFGQAVYATIRSLAADGILNLTEIRLAFSNEKEYLDYMLDKATEMNLMIGLPQRKGNRTISALRNLSEVLASVNVVGITDSGKKIVTKSIIPAKGFGQAFFNTTDEIVGVEVDSEKIYPQTDYSDDTAPRKIDDNDALLFIKREFDRQKFGIAEKNARTVLQSYSNFDDAKTLLGRSLLAQDKTTDAQHIFQEILNERLPSARSLAWANFGLGEIARKKGQKTQAIQFYKKSIEADAEYGAALSARNGRNKLKNSKELDNSVTAFFNEFDKRVNANNKSEIESLIMPGEVFRFAGNVTVQAQQWKTKVLHVDEIDEANVLVETEMQVKLLNRKNETGMAVYRLTKLDDNWKLSGVEIFEVR